MPNSNRISGHFDRVARAVIYQGDCREFLEQIPEESLQLIVTSPPYNIGKEYEQRAALTDYVAGQRAVITACVERLAPGGSICWQVGNYVEQGAIVPLDIALFPIFDGLGLKLRNRIVWHFGHGLHASRRFSGRYETILWFTKGDDYLFDLDAIRVPQKYPQKKHYKGGKRGELSGNPLGKNPSDIWEIPNVKSNHVEKTEHPCQFPVELVERLVLALTQPGDRVFDPYLGVGSTVIAAVRRDRVGLGSELSPVYAAIARERTAAAMDGTLPVRPLGKSVYDPALPRGGH